MKTVIALVALGVLAGCQTKQVEEMSYTEQKALAQQIVQRCYDQGVKTGTPEMNVCLQAEVNREKFKRRNAPRLKFNPAGAAAALQNTADGYNRAAANSAGMNRTVTCNNVPSPTGMTKVRCY